MGLERTFYQVSEDVEELELCVSVFSPDVQCPIEFAFNISITTNDNTAGASFCSLYYILCCLTMSTHYRFPDNYHNMYISLPVEMSNLITHGFVAVTACVTPFFSLMSQPIKILLLVNSYYKQSLVFVYTF